MTRFGRGLWAWSVYSNNLDIAMEDVLKKLVDNKQTYADTAIPIQILFKFKKNPDGRFLAG